MKNLIFFVCLLYAGYSYGQNGSGEYKNQVRQFWQQISVSQLRIKEGKPTVVKQSMPFSLHAQGVAMHENHMFDELITELDGKREKTVYRHIVNGRYSELPVDSVVLNREELHEILTLITSKKPLLWSNELLGNVRFIDTSYLDSVYSEPKEFTSYTMDAWYSGLYYELSAPLFFRNYTLCVFYWSKNGDDGVGEMSVYRKVGNNWLRIGSLLSWER